MQDQNHGIMKVSVGPRQDRTVEKKPLEIHIKGYTYTGKTTVTEIISRALEAHGIVHEVKCLDGDLALRRAKEGIFPDCIEHVKARANITIIDNNERPGN